MNKSFFIALAALLLGGVGGVQAQQSKQKIGNNPYKITQPDAVLEIESTNKGVLLPRVALTATTSPAPLNAHVAGMVVYNTATAGDVTPGQYTNNGTAWVKNEATKTVGQDVVSDCTASGFSTVNLVKGVASSGLNFTVTLTNNTLSAAGPLSFNIGDLVLSGANAGLTVSGVSPTTASITPGLAQVVTYTITGTPTGSGVLTGKWKKLSLSCDNTRNVDGTLVAALNCAGATFNTAFTDNTASYFTKIVLPYTGGNGGGYAAQTLSSTGVTGMTATLAAGNLAVGAGNLTFTVSGTPSASGNADFSVSIGGKTCTVSLNVWSFSTTNNGSTAALTSRSCNAIKLANASATDGTYYIDIDGVDTTYSAQEAYCDMTGDGGGWTLVAQWGNKSTVTTVSKITPTTTGQLGTNFIRQLASFSTAVRLQSGNSEKNLSASVVSSTASTLTDIRNGNGYSVPTPRDLTPVRVDPQISSYTPTDVSGCDPLNKYVSAIYSSGSFLQGVTVANTHYAYKKQSGMPQNCYSDPDLGWVCYDNCAGQSWTQEDRQTSVSWWVPNSANMSFTATWLK